jgi:putative ABC transport system permease protein
MLQPSSLYESYVKVLPFAMQNLFRNKVRSFLTMVGVSIGVASVLAMVTLGQFAKERILSSYSELGISTLRFRGFPNWNQRATEKVGQQFSSFSWEKDIQPLSRIFPEVQWLTPLMSSWKVSLHFGGQIFDDDPRILGVNEEALVILKRKISRGTGISSLHVQNKSPVCLIGHEVAATLFHSVEPLGEILRVSDDDANYNCRIIGVLAKVKSRDEGLSSNQMVLVPYTYYQVVAPGWWAAKIRQILLEMKPGTDVEKTGKALKAFFKRKYGSSGEFKADADSILISQMNRFLNVFSLFLASVALISLAVGGIGIANMMLVSVGERFREIGLRKALGATNLSIRRQFLLEAILLCGIAGLVGLACGFAGYQMIIWGASKLIPKFQFEWVFNLQAIFFSTLAILGVGILSGIIPAMRAEKLTPIEALRTE